VPPATPSSARDYELLGDLHEKQARLADAIEAYQKAVAQNPDPKTAAALYRKLARASLSQAAELDAEAKKAAVAKALEYVKRLQEAETPVAKPAAAPVPVQLPAKLTISAPKKLLDLAGSGKISFEEFKKAATVDYLTFTAEGRPAEKPTRP
jgi:tetratricopeptide (TPR) repeat protein